MSEAKHTPGPWEVDGLDVYRKGTTEWICESEHAGRSTDTLSADLNLIGAAPEMLASLRWVLAIIEDSYGIAGWHINGDLAAWSEFEEEVGAIRFAIQKARGKA